MASVLQRLLPRRSAVVFEMGAAGMRAAQATSLGGRRRVRDSLRVRRPLDGSEPASPSVSGVADLAQQLIQQGRFIGRDVGLILSPPDVHFHALRVPDDLLQQSPETVCEALSWEVAKELRAEATDLEVRYWPLPSEHRQGLNVMSVGMQRSLAHEWVAQFAARGLDLQRIDVSPSALMEMAIESRQAPQSGLWLIIDLGLSGTHLTVLIDRTPVYVRSIPARGDQWTQTIASTFELEYEAAEALKQRHGLQPLSGDAALQQALSSALTEPIDALIHEAILCCRYAAQSYIGRPMQRVLLAGGGSHLPGLAERMHQTLEVPVERLAAGYTNDADLCGCIGGALRDLEAA